MVLWAALEAGDVCVSELEAPVLRVVSVLVVAVAVVVPVPAVVVVDEP